MKEIVKQRLKVVQSKDPQRFQNDFNETADELEEYDPTIEVKEEGGTHFAYFRYAVHKQLPETIEDEFTLAGIHHHCSDCPFLEIGHDARRKTWPCRYSEYGESNMERPACEVFLRKLMQGAARVRGVEPEA